MQKTKGSSWGQQQRLRFIDFRLYWEGRINRADLMEHFGVSVPQASLDLREYQLAAPGNVEYDTRAKIYLATAAFRPVFIAESADSYLGQLLAIATGTLAKENVFIGWVPPTDIVRAPLRRVVPDVLLTVLRGIHQELVMEVEYQSDRHVEPSRLQMTPHALFFDGYRWHVRAYCHSNSKFGNYLLGRLVRVTLSSRSTADPQLDDSWHTFVEVKIAPHSQLQPSVRRAIELDYGMTDGVAVIALRRALLGFVLRYLGFVADSRDQVRSQQIVLVDEEKIAPYLSQEGSAGLDQL